MSVLIRFAPASLTAAQYDDAVQRMTEAGIYPAEGLEYEICFGSGDKMKVSQVWDTKEQLRSLRRQDDADRDRTGNQPRRTGGARSPQHHEALEPDPGTAPR